MYTRLDPARPIRITPASHKPSHQLNRLRRPHTHTQPTSSLHPSASNSTRPCQSTHPTTCVFPPSPTTVPGRSAGIGVGIDEDEQRKSKVPKYTLSVAPWLVLRGATVKRTFRVGVRVRRVRHCCRICWCLCRWCPRVQVQANHRTPPVVPQHRLQDDPVQPSSSSLPLSVPVATSVPQNPQDKDSTSPTTSTPTPAPFIYPSGHSRANQSLKDVDSGHWQVAWAILLSCHLTKPTLVLHRAPFIHLPFQSFSSQSKSSTQTQHHRPIPNPVQGSSSLERQNQETG